MSERVQIWKSRIALDKLLMFWALSNQEKDISLSLKKKLEYNVNHTYLNLPLLTGIGKNGPMSVCCGNQHNSRQGIQHLSKKGKRITLYVLFISLFRVLNW